MLSFVGPFVLKAQDGQPFMTLDRVAPILADLFYGAKQLGRGIQNSAEKVTKESNAGKTKVYRSVGANGNHQYSNVQPTDTEFEIIWVDPDFNVIETVKASPIRNNTDSDPGTANFPLLSASPGQIKELVEDAKQIQEQSNERQELLDSL